MKRLVMAGLVLTAALTALPASAQWGGGYGGGYGPGGGGGYRQYDDDDDDDDMPRRRRSYRYEERGPRFSGICVTARGNCMTRPAPPTSPCGCEVPGFGFKRGAIAR